MSFWSFWSLFTVGYLSIGYLLGQLVVMLNMDERPTEDLSFIHWVLRILFFPFGAHDWEERGIPSSPINVPLIYNHEPEFYVKLHTFLWPLLRAIPTFIGTLSLTAYSVFKVCNALNVGVNGLFAGLQKIIPLGFKGNLQTSKVKEFLSETISQKEKLSQLLQMIRERREHISKIITKAEEIENGTLSSRVTSLIRHMKKLREEEDARYESAKESLHRVRAAKRELEDHLALLALYREAGDLADTRDQQDKVFQSSLVAMTSVRKADMLLKRESRRAMVIAELPYSDIEHIAREDARNTEEAIERLSEGVLM